MNKHWYTYSWSVPSLDDAIVGEILLDDNLSLTRIRDAIYRQLALPKDSTGILKFYHHHDDPLHTYEMINGVFV